MTIGVILGYASEFGAFLFGIYKYTQGHRFWVCILWGLLAEVVLRGAAFSLMGLAGIVNREKK